MLRAMAALQEWLDIRSRVREEHAFHLDRATTDFRELGFSPREATQRARARFGSRANLRMARRELGGDWKGLAHLLHAHRVIASAWLQPIVLLAAFALILGMSSAPGSALKGVAGISPKWEDRGVVFLSAHGRYPWGITPPEFAAIRSMTTVTQVEPYRERYARARAADGVTLEAIQSEARAKTGHRRVWAVPQSAPSQIAMGPAWALWLGIALYSVYRLRASPVQFSLRWLLYGSSVIALHALVSLTAWAVANQLWIRSNWSAFGFSAFVLALMGAAAIEVRYAWNDLLKRCPVCLDRLLLPLTKGTETSVLLNPSNTETVCAHGHGVLVESRWARRFRGGAGLGLPQGL